MPSERPVTITRPGEGRTVGVVGELYRFLGVGGDTGGRYALWEALVPPGGGPPPHVHSREDEGFFVLDGEMTFRAEGRVVTAGPGTFLNLPIGVPHSFRNESDRTARMLILVAPAGLERMFEETGIPIADASTPVPPVGPEEIRLLLEVAPRYGVEILPPEGP